MIGKHESNGIKPKDASAAPIDSVQATKDSVQVPRVVRDIPEMYGQDADEVPNVP